MNTTEQTITTAAIDGNTMLAEVPALYDMKLNEELEDEMKWGVRYSYKRVPGGWIYQPIERKYNGDDVWLQPLFVPFNNEFQ
jgi:hypothetical protein